MELLTKSLLVLAAATATDIHSSHGKYEANPILRRGPFGGRQVSLKLGLVGANVLGQHLLSRRSKRYAKPLAYTNFVLSGVTVGVAAKNYTVKPVKDWK